MIKNLKKKLSLILSLNLILSLGFNNRIFASDLFKQGELKLIEIKTDELIVGENFPNKAILNFNVSPSKIPKFDPSNDPTTPLQIKLDELEEYVAKVIVFANNNQIANKEHTDDSIYETDSFGNKIIKQQYDVATVPIYEAADDKAIDRFSGEIKLNADGTVPLKKYYFDPKQDKIKKPFPGKVQGKSVYALNINLSIGADFNNNVFAKKWFSNELSNRIVTVNNEQKPVPKIILNGKEVYTDFYAPLSSDISIHALPKGSNRSTGSILIYSKEIVSPIININADNINKISSDIGDKVKSRFDDTVKKFRTYFNIKDSKNSYYIKDVTVVSKDSNKSDSDYLPIKTDDVFEENKDYALKLEISPRIFYKFKDEVPVLEGSLAVNNQNKYTIKKESNGNISILLKYDNIVKYHLKNKDLSLQTIDVRDGDIIVNNERPTVLKGNEYATFSDVMYFKLEQGQGSNEVLNDNFEPDEKFDKNKKYKLAIKVIPKKGIGLSDSNLPEVLLNGESVKIVKDLPSKPKNNGYFILSDTITPESITVESVEISPKEVELNTDSTFQFNALVRGNNNSQDVDWSISGNISNNTNISTNGMLRIDAMETSTLINVKATSAQDRDKSDQAIVRIKNKPNPPQPPAVKKYKLSFTDNITVMVDNVNVVNNSMVEENKEVKLKLNVEENKEIKSFTVNNKEVKSEVVNNMYSFAIKADTDIVLTLQDKVNKPNPPQPPAVKKYKLSFTDNITVMVDNVNVVNNSMVEENKEVKLKLNVEENKEIKSFTVNNKEVKNEVANNMYSFTIKADTDIVLKLQDKVNNNSGNGSNNSSSGHGSQGGGGGSSSSSSNNNKKSEKTEKITKDSKNNDDKNKSSKKSEESKKNNNAISIEKATEIVNSFKDISEITWSKKAIINIVSKGFMKGYPNGKFMPKQELNRAQVAQVLSNIIGMKSNKVANFSDVSKNNWYFDAVNTVVDKKIFVGYKNGTFMPYASITRGEIFVAIAKLKNISPISEKESDEILKKYNDAQQIPLWSKGYIAALVKENKISGSNNMIYANSKLTREQLATLIDNIIK